MALSRAKLTFLGEMGTYVKKLSKPMLKATLTDVEEPVRATADKCASSLPYPQSYYLVEL